MVDQARLVVFKAVANATKLAMPESLVGVAESMKSAHSSICTSNTTPMPVGADASNSSLSRVSNLSGFRSALSLTSPADQVTPSLQKARSSALKLNSVLYGKSNGSSSCASIATTKLGERRNRSVKWDGTLQLPRLVSQLDSAPTPDAKKMRMSENANKLKSFKSFGRPHAGVFGSGPRNATFGEYSRAHLWGRDGRMAHHPMPMEAAARNQLGMSQMTADKNATFDFSTTSALSQSHTSGTRPPVDGEAPLRRSATVLERMLMKSTGNSGF